MSDSENAQFRNLDLPEELIPGELGISSSSVSESDSDSVPSTQNPLLLPSMPVNQPGASASSFGFSESEETPSFPVSNPKPKRVRYPQRFSSKRQGPFRIPSKIKQKRVRLFTNRSKLIKDCPIPKTPALYDIMLNDDQGRRQRGGRGAAAPLALNPAPS